MMTDDIAACRALLKGGSRTFHAASLLLPRRVADPAIALYAFCRLADDAVDHGGDRAAAVAQLQQRLDRAYAGRPAPHPADRAFAAVVQQFAIPRDLPGALLEGLAWDAAGRRYDTLADLTGYAARVAGSVGVMMSLLMGRRAPDVLARACDLGVAMQFTNIARDVGEDARAGRLYLPLHWLQDSGIAPMSFLAQPFWSPALANVVQRLLTAADELYDRAAGGIAQLPPACRPGMQAARLLYAEIGREVERRGLDPVSQRAVVSPQRKLAVALGAAMAAAASCRAAGALSHPPLLAARHLIDAVGPLPRAPQRSLEARLIGVLDLFTRLEQRDRLQHEGSSAPS